MIGISHFIHGFFSGSLATLLPWTLNCWKWSLFRIMTEISESAHKTANPMIWQNNTCRSQVTTPFEFCFSCWIFVKVFALIFFSCYIYGVVKLQTWISLKWYIWISRSCYMDLSKLIHVDLSCCMDFSILIFGFVTYTCQSCPMT